MVEGKRFSQYQETFKTLKSKSSDEKNTFNPQKNGENVRLLAGVDEGKFAISVISDDHQLELSSTSLIHLRKIDMSNNKVALIFTLTDEQLLSIFISFAIDLESIITINEKIGIVEIYNRYLYWQKMFKVESKTVSEEIIKGLINELYILDKYMIPKYGISESINGWVGSEGSHKDFAYNDGLWYEAKAINIGKITVKISSVEQLDSEEDGILLITDFEKTSTQNREGIRLFDLLKRIINTIETDSIKMIFINKVISLGISIDVFDDPTHQANLFRYLIKNISSYKVDYNFPRLKREELSNAFGLISYEIIIAEIQKYKVDFY